MSDALRAASAFPAIAGLVHGFDQRDGATREESRSASRQRVSKALAAHGRLFFLTQVHGTVVRQAPWDETPEGDAALADTPGVLVGVETADCLPVLLVDPAGRRVAAVHAGWRGTVAGVAREAVSALATHGTRPNDVVAALGPGIGVCCYEVGDDVRAAFGPAGEPFFRPGRRDRLHLDVRAANVAQLLEAGLVAEHIFHVADCTSCSGDLYPSFRRDGPGAGRMISYVGWTAA